MTTAWYLISSSWVMNDEVQISIYVMWSMHRCNEPKRQYKIRMVKRRREIIRHNAHTVYSEDWKRATDRRAGRAARRAGGARGRPAWDDTFLRLLYIITQFLVTSSIAIYRKTIQHELNLFDKLNYYRGEAIISTSTHRAWSLRSEAGKEHRSRSRYLEVMVSHLRLYFKNTFSNIVFFFI